MLAIHFSINLSRELIQAKPETQGSFVTREGYYRKIPEVGKAQFEAQSATSTASAIAEVALRFIFLF